VHWVPKNDLGVILKQVFTDQIPFLLPDNFFSFVADTCCFKAVGFTSNRKNFVSIVTMTHQRAACDAASIHFSWTISMTDILVSFIIS